jgi:hypothetical protein
LVVGFKKFQDGWKNTEIGGIKQTHEKIN